MDTDFDREYIDRLAVHHGLSPLTDATVDALLSLAGAAAHGSGDRRNAPLTCFLAGLTAARSAEEPSAGSVAAFAALGA